MLDSQPPPTTDDDTDGGKNPRMPAVALPKGGGAIRSLGEKVASNPVTGGASLTLQLAVSPGRGGFAPGLSLAYDSAAGSGPWGIGWSLHAPSISRRTDKGIPRYADADDSDVFILAGAEDLVPALVERAGAFEPDTLDVPAIDGATWHVRRYRPRVEGLFGLVERWTHGSSGDTHWRTITRQNEITIYGRDDGSRIFDPADPRRVFSWLICERFDDKGNAALYEYKSEDSVGVDLARAEERNRTDQSRAPMRYLKRVRYGNATPADAGEDLRARADWLFEVVLDYGDHAAAVPTPQADAPWPVRSDPFSSYRAGFEVRTYRLCRRLLMFHHFPTEVVGASALVRSFQLDYDQRPVATRLARLTETGYLRAGGGSITSKSMPPLDFVYSEPATDAAVAEVVSSDFRGFTTVLGNGAERWLDLDGEAIPGVLSEQGGSLFYRRNEGGGRLGPPRALPLQPSLIDLGRGRQQLVDLAGDGLVDLAIFGPSVHGFYERTPDAGWAGFRAFRSLPNLDMRDDQVQAVDLTGDGRADLLLGAEVASTWFPSLGQDGFGPGERAFSSADEERGPSLVFADGTQTVQLADMSGDGLHDVVRIRNGEVCYWPNLGYGRFGAKVTMRNAPRFAPPGEFDARRLRVGDVDGAGPSDLAYLGSDGVRLYANESGNGWGPARLVAGAPTDEAEQVGLVDILGNGTSCLVWSSSLPSGGRETIHFLPLVGADKPHLLTRIANNMGAETTITYRASTEFFLADRTAGQPWVTRLPFPVQCVGAIEAVDHVTGHRFVTSYSYHHGYFDPVEREFRGFGRVEQLESETFDQFSATGATNAEDARLHQPPVLTRTWIHTGAPPQPGESFLHPLGSEYFQNPQQPEHQLPDAALPAFLTPAELREARRACKGMQVHQEITSPDGSAVAANPYSVTHRTGRVNLIQPKGQHRFASFLVTESETVVYQYDRNVGDPRIAHTFVLEIDEQGNTLRGASVAYPRRVADATLPPEVQAAQAQQHITYTELAYTSDVRVDGLAAVYRSRIAYENRAFELTGVMPADGRFFIAAELDAAVAAATVIPFEQPPPPGPAPARRQLSRARVLFRTDDLAAALPAGQHGTRALVYEAYQMVYTPGLVSALFEGRAPDALLAEAGYVHLDGGAEWWLPSGRSVFATDAADHFYLSTGTVDPFGGATSIQFDAHDLLVVRALDPVGNVFLAHNDYRVLGPDLVTDPNGNRSAAAHDELGMVVRTAVMGKEGAGEGDTLDAPTVRFEYALTEWTTAGRPNFARAIARAVHGATDAFHETFSYTDGNGALVMVKVQAEPGLAQRLDPVTGQIQQVDTTPAVRWIGSGRVVINNKGNVVKQYQPYFSVTPAYESSPELVASGVSSAMIYDAVGRMVRSEHPDGTLTRVEFDPWQRRSFDANDTVLESTWYSDRGSPSPSGEPEPAEPERRAAWLAARHAGTPARSASDSLGRTILAVSDNGAAGVQSSRAELDLTAATMRLFDSRGRLASASFADMAGGATRGTSAEKGDRWILRDVTGRPFRIWDGAGRVLRVAYDAGRRPLATFLDDGSGAGEALVGLSSYGEQHPEAADRNLRGRLFQGFDQAGLLSFDRYDFKGNHLQTRRRLARTIDAIVDWTSVAAVGPGADREAAASGAALIEGEVFAASAQFDAFNRPTTMTLPDGTLVHPTYNEGKLLATLSATLGGQGGPVPFLVSQKHNEKGQRMTVTLGNGATTSYGYDPANLRLRRLTTRRADGELLQDLQLVFDPAGHPVEIGDGAQQTLFFDNAVVAPRCRYQYDAIYQLVEAEGREQAGAITDGGSDARDLPANPVPHPNDANAVRTYTESYDYDDLGNMLAMRHQAGAVSWTRRYQYAYQLDPANRTNRLIATSLPGDGAGQFSAPYAHDSQGNMSAMPHLASLTWNFLDQLRQVDLGGGGRALYVYAASGQRLRKVIQRQGATSTERIYLGAVEIYRERQGTTLTLERRTLQVLDEAASIARVDTTTVDTSGQTGPAPVIRYQYGNHLGSALLETDEAGAVISYEEYHPFGSTAYRAGRSAAEVSLKRYRFAGKERDDETGLYALGARYYAAWLGRWTSPDPAGVVDGLNQYRYGRNNPISMSDPRGTQSEHVFDLPKGLQKLIHDHRAESGRKLEDYLTHHEFNVDGQAVQLHGSVGWDTTRKQWFFKGEATPVQKMKEAKPRPDKDAEAAPPAEAAQGTAAGAPGAAPANNTNALEPAREAVRAGATPRARTGPVGNAQRPGVAATAPEASRSYKPGQFLDEPYNLWSKHPEGLEEAVRSPGFIMEDTVFEQTSDQIARSLGYADRYAVPYGTPEFSEVWHGPSDSLAVRAGLSQTPVASHGLDVHAAPETTVQVTREIPRIQIAGGVMAQLGKVSGVLTVVAASQIDNPVVRGTGMAAGATEFMAGNVYLYGMASIGSGANSAAIMSGARLVGGVAGGIGMAVLSGYQAYREFQAGDNVAGGFDTAAAVGGVAIAVAAVIGAPALAIAGAVLGLAAVGFHVGRWAGWW